MERQQNIKIRRPQHSGPEQKHVCKDVARQSVGVFTALRAKRRARSYSTCSATRLAVHRNHPLPLPTYPWYWNCRMVPEAVTTFSPHFLLPPIFRAILTVRQSTRFIRALSSIFRTLFLSLIQSPWSSSWIVTLICRYTANMPLQKLPPHGPLSASALTNQRPQLQDRRRTLHTISELSTTDGGLPEFVSSIGIENIRRLGHDNIPGMGRTTPKPVKRQSIPQYHSSHDILVARPSISVTHTHRPILQSPTPCQGQRPTPVIMDQGEGWNAKRERARMWQEQTLAEAMVRRSASDQGVELDMSTVRPSARSWPTSTRNPASQKESLESICPGNYLPRQVERHASLGSINNRTSQYDARPEASERASTDSSSYQSRDSAVHRSRSGSSNTSYTSQEAPPLPNGSGSDMKGYCAELIVQNRNLVSFGESARSKNLNPNISRRTLSLPTGGFKHTSAPHHIYATTPNHRRLSTQQPRHVSAQQARNQALAALTAVNSYSRTNQGSQYPIHTYHPRHQNRHVSLTSHPPTSSAHRRSTSPHQNSVRYHAQLEAQHRIASPSPAHYSNDISRASLHRNTNKSRRVSFEQRTVPKRESLTQWKKEREEAKDNLHTDHKAKMQERVRRANELEEEREKELVSMGKRTAKTESKSCFGGLFAMMRNKSN